jgi:hypothetical protein
MHFHLPKPLHGWREFAGEVGIIVIGVLIALGVEQVVQAFHDRKVARDAREAINLEIAADLYDLGKRTRTEPCITRRLNEIDALIGSATQAGPVKSLLWIGRPQVWTVQESAWTSASQAGRTALFSPSDQNDYAAVYALMETVRSAELHEQDVWAQLRGLEGEGRIPSGSIIPLRSLVSQARTDDWHIKVFSLQAKHFAAERHIRPRDQDPLSQGSISVCVSSNTPRQRAIQIIDGNHPYLGSDYGEP